MPSLPFNMLGKILGGNQSQAKDPITKRPGVAPTMGGGFLEQYGIFTPEQKRAMEDAQQQSQNQQMDLLRSQLTPAQNANYLALQGGRGLGQSLGQALQPAQQPQSQGQSPGQMGQDFSNMVAQNGGDVAKAMTMYAAQLIKSQDPNLQNAGVKMLMDAKKMQLDQDKDQAQINRDTTQSTQNTSSANKLDVETKDLKNPEPKEGELQTIWKGRNAIQQRYSRKDHQWHNVGEGDRSPRQETVQGTPDQFGLTNSQKGEELQEWQKLQIAANDMGSNIDKLIGNIKTNPNSAGNAGQVTTTVKNGFDTVGSLISTATGKNPFDKTVDKDVDFKAADTRLQKIASAAALNKALVSDIAYMYAKVKYDQKGQGLSNKDYDHVIDRMGAAFSDPKLAVMLLEDMKDEISRYVKNYASVKGFTPPGGGGSDEVPSDIQAILKKHNIG